MRSHTLFLLSTLLLALLLSAGAQPPPARDTISTDLSGVIPYWLTIGPIPVGDAVDRARH